MAQYDYDLVVIGGGISGAIIANELAKEGLSILIMESGPEVSPNSRAAYLDTFYKATTKTPESPYPPQPYAPDGTPINPARMAVPNATTAQTFGSYALPDWQQKVQQGGYIYDPDVSYLLQAGPLPFLSTNERLAGGTTWHWLGTSLRNVDHDFTMHSTYGDIAGAHIPDWPLTNSELLGDYASAEYEIGVAADSAAQASALSVVGVEYPSDYQYPMRPLEISVLDQTITDGLNAARDPNGSLDFWGFEGLTVEVTQTPAGRNSQPYGTRRVCAGNTNCIPICPIQAKYDGTVTLAKALSRGTVTLKTQCVVTALHSDGYDSPVTAVSYMDWSGSDIDPERSEVQTVSARVFVLAAHAIESAKLLLNSPMADGKTVANSSDQVGRNLMDHPLYLSWALMDKPVYGYRGPLSTSGIETLRDGAFRKDRAAFRIEIGNEGWNFPIVDPYTTTQDFIDGTNLSCLNPPGADNAPPKTLFGDALTATLNDLLTRQWRVAFLVEQDPDPECRVTIDPQNGLFDGLGLPRPIIHYSLSDYTKRGFVMAEIFARNLYATLGATAYTSNAATLPNTDGEANPVWFKNPDPEIFKQLPERLQQPDLCCDRQAVPEGFVYFGSGHIVGTLRMGDQRATSVVSSTGQSWDHANLFIAGSAVFPTVATANPTLTMAALCFRTATAIKSYIAAAP